jgi:solute carrier family 25 uncoupling protein 8/9
MKKILAGLISGAIGISFANPTDVVKVKLQGQGKGGAPKIYANSMDCYR